MVMPEMSGAVLAERLSAIHPEMTVVYMSGYVEYAAEATAGRHGQILQSRSRRTRSPEWSATRSTQGMLSCHRPSAPPPRSWGLFPPPTVQLT